MEEAAEVAAAAEEVATVEEAAAVVEPSDVSHRTSAEDGVGSDRWPLNQSDWIAGAREGWPDMFESSRIGEGPPGPYVYVFGVAGACLPAGQQIDVRSGGLTPQHRAVEICRVGRRCVPLLAPACPAACLAFCLPRRCESCHV